MLKRLLAPIVASVAALAVAVPLITLNASPTAAQTASAPIMQTAPTSGTTTVADSATFSSQLEGTINTLSSPPTSVPTSILSQSVDWFENYKAGSPAPPLNISASGRITTAGVLQARTYTVTGTVSSRSNPALSLPAGSGTWTFTLTVASEPNAPVVGMAMAPPATGGYWLVGADGGVFAYGNAPYLGSMAGQTLAAPIVGMPLAPGSKGGYWLVGSDGGVFAYGSAPYFGSMAGQTLAAPIVGIMSSVDGQGYTLVAADGGVFCFGDAVYLGSG